ncbi:hypothetical protein CA54_41820 [Symmachiella macrocystis]|uniref:Uncharacterized protein n=1 Tax=Symmachiella macrocystis TaxID=2527985 RepID=A0A5C6BA24_9PLAN|nr:hypothetical protein [Symmachiella macrocystis]TWU08943.1 hypothetical protein CA54_41820 [Symmachiella macrocystis]
MNQFHDLLVLAQLSNQIGITSGEMIFIALCGFELIGLAVTFAKAGKPWWGTFIPIYKNVFLLQIAPRIKRSRELFLHPQLLKRIIKGI